MEYLDGSSTVSVSHALVTFPMQPAAVMVEVNDLIPS